MAESFVSVNNGTQTIELPDEARFPAGVKKVHIRLAGCDRILSPLERTWDSFFLSDDNVTDDFMTERLGGSHCE